MGSMSHASPDPFSATTRLLVDGTNLLHALSSTPERAPAAALVGRLRGVVPAAVAVEIIFDGIPDRGMRGERIAGGLRVRHAGRRTADALLLSLVDEIAGADGPQATAGILVVTDDRELRDRLRAKGARSAGTAWEKALWTTKGTRWRSVPAAGICSRCRAARQLDPY